MYWYCGTYRGIEGEIKVGVSCPLSDCNNVENKQVKKEKCHPQRTQQKYDGLNSNEQRVLFADFPKRREFVVYVPIQRYTGDDAALESVQLW